MKRTAVTLTMFLVASTAIGQAAPQPEKPKSAADEMAMYEEMARPVAEHARLTALAGKWKMSMKLWNMPGDVGSALTTSTVAT